MESNKEQVLNVKPLHAFFYISLLGLGWMVVFWLLVNTHKDQIISQHIYSFCYEFIKLLFVGAFIGSILNKIITKYIMSESADSHMRKCGIQDIYPSRYDERILTHFDSIVKNPNTRNIYLLGVSLRDFFHEQGKLHEIWNDIIKRLQQEEDNELPEIKRLKVRCLLLSPHSPEGVLRFHAEEQELGQGLKEDVPISWKNIINASKKHNLSRKYLDVRQYEHCPYAFLFGTDEEIMVEQYYYKNHKGEGNIPVCSYMSNSHQYDRFKTSYDYVWNVSLENKRIPKDYQDFNVGAFDAVYNVNMKNIYRKYQKTSLTKRELHCINSPINNELSLLAITGIHFVTNQEYVEFFNNNTNIQVKFALVNPVSPQAIIRAVSDSVGSEYIGDTLRSWDWKRHKESLLYRNAHDTINEISKHIRNNKPIELRIYNSPITCSLVITSNSIFIEQYSLGRSIDIFENRVLGGEYPVVEISRSSPSSIEEQILTSHFDVIWKNFSLDFGAYNMINEESRFRRNINLIFSELSIPDKY